MKRLSALGKRNCSVCITKKRHLVVEERCDDCDGLFNDTETEQQVQNKTGHIVCMNDSTQAIVLGTVEEAKAVRDRLRLEHWEQNKCQFEQTDDDESRFAAYCKVVFWHVHENVPIEQED